MEKDAWLIWCKKRVACHLPNVERALYNLGLDYNMIKERDSNLRFNTTNSRTRMLSTVEFYVPLSSMHIRAKPAKRSWAIHTRHGLSPPPRKCPALRRKSSSILRVVVETRYLQSIAMSPTTIPQITTRMFFCSHVRLLHRGLTNNTTANSDKNVRLFAFSSIGPTPTSNQI